MFDNFLHRIDKELGPLYPDWFEELTAKVSRDEGRPDISKVEEEEAAVKVPETSALASQLFSTPKIFKQQRFQSPASIPNEESPCEVANGDLSAFPWTESSPCLFDSAKDRYGIFSKSYSYFSLAKTEDRAPSSSGLKDKEAIFVRKLFPSLSKDSASNATLSDAALKQNVKSETLQADDLGEKSVCSPNTSFDTSGLWKQKVPSAIEDGDVRSTVQNVLDGAEDVLSIFFSNSTSTLRKIKTKERIRKRITDCSKDVRSVVLTSEPEEILQDDVETKSPSKNKDIIQWTPLSLSESILNDCSDASLINSHNIEASSETNGGTVFNCIAESSQTFSQSVKLLIPGSYPEGAECQKTLLEKSSAFMPTRKTRKFVYQVPSSDLSKTVIGHKETQPVCLDQTLKEDPSIEEVCSDLTESRITNENAVNNHPQPQDVKELSIEPHDLDHGLDMTQLSKAFAEDFTQEKMLGALPVQSDQNIQVQYKAELEEKNEDVSHNDVSNLADVTVDSSNKSTVMLKTSEISHDSGCPTTFPDLDGMTASCTDIKELFPSFKTANNKSISISNEAIMKARASLDEVAGDVLISTLNGTSPKDYQTIETLCKSISGSTNANRPPLGQSSFPTHASRVRVSDAPKSDSPKSFKINISSCSSPQSNESDYKTGSKRNITVSDVGFKTETLLKEKVGRGSDSSKCIHQKLDFKSSAERQTVFEKPTAVDSSCDDDEKNGTLTASQKADVTELCNLLEEANSQHEFTQFKPTNPGLDNHTTEKEWDPDILNGIDFDDSFNCDGVKGKHPIKMDASSVNSSDHIQIADKLTCTMSKETQNGTVPLSVAEDRQKSAPIHCFGFKTAKGEAISISEKSLNDARHFFEEDDQKAIYNKDVKIGIIKPDCAEIVPSVNTSDKESYGFQTASGKGVSISASALKKAKNIFKDCDENIDLESVKMEGKNEKLDVKSAFTPNSKSVTFSNMSLIEANTVFRDSDLTNAFSLQPSSVQQPPQEELFKEKSLQSEFKHPSELLPPNGNCGFSTASGKKVSVSAGALQRAKDLLSESVDGFSCADGSPKTKPVVDIQTDTSSIGIHKGFSTAGGKKVAVSAVGLQKAKNLFRDCEEESLSSEDPQHQNFKGFSDVSEKPLTAFAGCSHKHETGDSSGRSIGFSTAGGKKVAFSAAALQRAKNLFKDCEEESLASGSLQHQGCHGFTTASGKDVTVSEKALSEVRAAFAGCDDTFFHHGPENSLGNNTGFSTAGGKKVAVSATALERATSILKDCEEENVSSEDVPPQTNSSHKSSEDVVDGNLLFEHLNKNNYGFSTASGKGVSVSKVALEEASKLFRDCDAQITATDSQLLQGDSSKCHPKDRQTKTTVHPLPSKATQNEPAQLDLHSLDFNSCTDTQQKYFEQEAMACTKALLADDDLNESASLAMTEDKKSPSVHDLQAQGSFGHNRRKRPFDARNAADSGQPPLKRQLLSEFDRTLDARTSGLTPLKSCPNGTLRDRRVFSYNVHLKPNVTGPDWYPVNQKSNDLKQQCSTVSVQNRCNSDPKGDTEPCQETLSLARDMQDMRLRKKKRQTIRPLPGRLYLAKTSGNPRIGLRDAVGCKCPGQYTQEELHQHGVPHKILQITSENAESFRFDCNDFFKRELLNESGAVQLADGGWLVSDNKGTVGKDEFYRYDVEVDHSQRSALRRIMERDDTPAKTLVLCVCGVAQTPQNPEKPMKDDKTPNAKMESCVVWLTDGWYSIKGLLDPPLSAMLNKGRLRIGDKIVTSGAELVGSQEACPPLEAPESLMLKWMEKKPNGVFIFRNDRAEDREARKHSNSKHKSMDLLISKIQTQFEKEMEGKKKSRGQRRTFGRHEIEALQDGEDLYEAMERDPAVEVPLC
ncbi:breast cancer type 2 susceptibility-like protein [Labeo rohita]|uniref:Breast cancer type 2 susceptibility-like protein n=1 Tax=Labeo rohita TaxID=84645 RepID=A0A498MF28_LABRO|nr:breast cancer type 2 susceptibility-like protein [Labeo rohita]